MNNQNLIVAREEYIKLVREDLLGPGSEISLPDVEHELISDRPESRYSLGILFPKQSAFGADNDESTDQNNTGTDETENTEDSEEEKQADISVSETKYREIEDDDNDDTEENNLDEEISLAAQNRPSSFGITFFVKGNCEMIKGDISFGTYRKAGSSDCRMPFPLRDSGEFHVASPIGSMVFYDKDENSLKYVAEPVKRNVIKALREHEEYDDYERSIFDAMYRLFDQSKNGYVRIPHKEKFCLDFGGREYIDENQNIGGTELKITAMRRNIFEDIYSVTIMVVNDSSGTEISTSSIFQPVLTIGTDNNKFVFTDYSANSDFSKLDEEEQSMEMQYRNKKSYATGLGTSVTWSVDSEGRGSVSNDFAPLEEVPSMDFTLPDKYSVPDEAFSMKYLSDLNDVDKEKKLGALKSIVDAYNQWIEELKERKLSLAPKYSSAAKRNIIGCEAACQRMYKGIEILRQNKNAWTSFSLANRAMYMQRVHLKLQEVTSNKPRYPDDEELAERLNRMNYYTADSEYKDRYAWRPFQIAFLLMSLESVVDENSSDRNLVDLIWFPTGGGKTEAYLGLTALTIFYRRLEYPEQSGGTAVMMRYTLRLLTSQQFTRASTLICACEYIRDNPDNKYPSYELGREAISIGLWIGGEHIPNKNDEAKKCVEKLREVRDSAHIDSVLDRYNKFQVLKCPWCGAKLTKGKADGTIRLTGEWGYAMHNNHFELRCCNQDCYFDTLGKLPIQVVDEELYANPPSLLFATVDKFAMMPWNNDVGAFFGIDSKNRAPELIIQDELHLISGPLGTMVGIYETALDILCKSKGANTKIIASTATIRRAKEQCAALYNRSVNQFPHPGIDAEDSFFAREMIIDHDKGIYGRTYVGLMPSGKTKAMMEVRSVASLLQRAQSMDLTEEERDVFWTLTMYFNSLKDLGKCSTLLDDDIKDAIKRSARRVGSEERKLGTPDELTSRVSTTQLNQTMDKLEKLSYSLENIRNNRRASNTVLATNMISVGIDIARLNVMAVVGQPKLTSEYIQASSRVGRKFPGVVFVLYDGAKSRDRSHYEQFHAYHQMFYKYVEPTGATPFSKPARDRALHAVIISVLRHKCKGLSADNSAGNFIIKGNEELIREIEDEIVAREKSVMQRISPNSEDDSENVRKEIRDFLKRWESLSAGFDAEKFFFGKRFMVKPPEQGGNEGRLMKPFSTEPSDPAIDTMTSMRNVDTMVRGEVLIWEE